MEISKIQTTSFKAMKPNQFKGFNYSCVRKFKAPVEKFETEKNFFGWAYDTLNRLVKEKCIAGKSAYTEKRRSELVFEWRTAIGFDLEKAPLALIILAPMLKCLKSNNDNLPPILSEEVLDKTIGEIESQLQENKDLQYNFKDVYCYNLMKNFGENYDKNYNGWIKFLSQKHDPKNYLTNVDRLKIFSNKTWCTKNYHANIFLKQGDFYVFLEQGEPKLGLRFDDENLLSEIQGINNNDVLDIKFFNIVHDFICEKNAALDGKALKTYHESKKRVDILNKYNKDLRDAILNNDSYKIFQYFDFEPEILVDGTISLKEYRSLTEDFDLDVLGIDEDSLFKNVSEIRGNAVFKDSKMTVFKNLKQILGNADFCNSKIIDLGSLERIEGDANFAYSKVENINSLKYVGKNLKLCHSLIKDLKNLEFVGGDFRAISLNSLGKLKYIGGDADLLYYFNKLEHLEEIGGNAYFGASLQGLGNLHTVRGDADFTYSPLKNLESLKYIGGAFLPGKFMTPETYSNIFYNEIYEYLDLPK